MSQGASRRRALADRIAELKEQLGIVEGDLALAEIAEALDGFELPHGSRILVDTGYRHDGWHSRPKYVRVNGRTVFEFPDGFELSTRMHPEFLPMRRNDGTLDGDLLRDWINRPS